MARTISLDGTWEFLYVAEDSQLDPIQVRPITVPGPWQAQFADLRMQAGTGIYRRTFTVPVGFRDGRLVLHFGAVFHHARVWVNGTPVGTHEGGFLPFAFDVSEYIREGENEIMVRVESPTDDPSRYPEAPFAEIPFGKQSWYGPLSGIWQTVRIEQRDYDQIARLKIVADPATGQVQVRAFFFEPLRRGRKLGLRILAPDGGIAAEWSEEIFAHDEEVAATLAVENPALWSPETPHLYRLHASLSQGDAETDVVEQTFGFRTIETRDGRFFLNGKPLYLRAALDQDYYPDTICTIPSEAFLEDQFRKAKELGLNCLRLHIKATDPIYYDVADRMGLLVWTELPNGGLSTERSRARKERLLRGIVDRDGHHPSIIIWTIVNENWGVDLVHDSDHRAWLKRTYHWLKEYDPTRLVVDNSPLAPSFHVETDIADFHFYAAFPDNRKAWDSFVEELAGRASWLYSPEGDAVIRGDEPVICSEFGNWGLPFPEELRDNEKREPWWFETGHDWGEGVMYAHGIEHRFTDWSLGRVFGTLRKFVTQAQWQQYRALKYEIEAMRRRPELAGYVITEFTDVHWESNGLLDMRRNTRVFHDVFAAVNGDTVVVPRWERLSHWSGETMSVDLSLAHGAGERIEGARIVVAAGDATLATIPVPPADAGSVVPLGTVGFALPETASPRMLGLDFTLEAADGRRIAANRLDTALHPRREPPRDPPSIWCSDGAMRERFAALGYPLAREMEGSGLVVTESWDKAIAAHVRAGGRMLLLPSEEMSLNPFFPHWQAVKVVDRAGTLWTGDWASTFGWLVRTGAFAALPGGPLVDETFDRVIPERVIVNCNLLDFQSRVHGALAIGWIHKPVATSVERAYGSGRFVVSTFRLMRDAPGADPTATTLLDALVALATIPARKPLPEGLEDRF